MWEGWLDGGGRHVAKGSEPAPEVACLPEPSAKHSPCGPMPPGALLLSMLTHGVGGRLQKGLPSRPSCSWLCYSRQQGREGQQEGGSM